MAATASIWLGQSESLLETVAMTEYFLGHIIPFEGLNKSFQFIFTAFIPIMIAVALCTSVVLNKTDPIVATIYTFIISLVFSILRYKFWKLALKNYTSASS